MRRLLATLLPPAALLLCVQLVPIHLWVQAPGSADPVLPRIAIAGAPTYRPDGRLLLTTVSLFRANLYQAARAGLDPAAFVVSEDLVIPAGQTDRQYSAFSRSQMDESKLAAVSVALDRTTDYPEDHGPGAIVYESLPGSPAAGRLFPGDLILEVDREDLGDIEQLGTAIDEAGSARAVRFRVRPLEGGKARTVSLRPVIDPRDGDPYVGILTIANFPFEVTIESGTIGGPSAVLMWSIGVADLLTPGDLTDGRVIAGTGEVGLDGAVRPIGGITLKVKAAEREGAEIFLLPEGNLEEARTVETALRLVPVSNVDQAISFLETAA